MVSAVFFLAILFQKERGEGMKMICLPGWLESGERDFTLSDWLKIGCRAGQGRRQVGLGMARGCPEEVRLAVTAGILSAGAD